MSKRALKYLGSLVASCATLFANPAVRCFSLRILLGYYRKPPRMRGLRPAFILRLYGTGGSRLCSSSVNETAPKKASNCQRDSVKKFLACHYKGLVRLTSNGKRSVQDGRLPTRRLMGRSVETPRGKKEAE